MNEHYIIIKNTKLKRCCYCDIKIVDPKNKNKSGLCRDCLKSRGMYKVNFKRSHLRSNMNLEEKK